MLRALTDLSVHPEDEWKAKRTIVPFSCRFMKDECA
jgi:hypothetical protein